jgi:hypothetical protein
MSVAPPSACRGLVHLELAYGGRFFGPARRLEAFGDHPGDRALGESFIPRGPRFAVQVRQTLRVSRQRCDLGLQIAPVINLYSGAADVKPVWAKVDRG